MMYTGPQDEVLWRIFDLAKKRWWPRAFRTREEAQAHYERCKGPSSNAEVRAVPPRDIRRCITRDEAMDAERAEVVMATCSECGRPMPCAYPRDGQSCPYKHVCKVCHGTTGPRE